MFITMVGYFALHVRYALFALPVLYAHFVGEMDRSREDYRID